MGLILQLILLIVFDDWLINTLGKVTFLGGIAFTAFI